jgi:hypothetical protein
MDKMNGMSGVTTRARTGAWVALMVLAISMSAGALCAALACPAVAVASCHPAPSGPRLSDCCAAHSSSTVASESRLATAAGPRLVSLMTTEAPLPAVGALEIETSSGRAAVVPLFTLHRSLLL